MVENMTSQSELEQLRQKAAWFDAIADNAPINIYLKALDGTFIWVNKRFATTFGKPAEDFIGKTTSAVHAKREVKSSADHDRHVIMTGKAERQEQENEFVRRTYDVLKCPVYGDDGKVAAIVGFDTDITEQKAAQERSERLIEVIDLLDESAILFDADDRVVFANESWKELNSQIVEQTRPGTSFEDHIRVGIVRGLFPEAVGREEEWLRERMEKHRNPQGPIVVARQDGRWISVHEQPLPDGGTILIISDISGLKQSEKAVQESEAKLREMLENSPIGVAIVTNSEEQNWQSSKRLFVNKELVRMFGARSAEELLEADISSSWVDQERLNAAGEITKDGGCLVDFQALRRRLDGTEWWVSMNSRPIIFDGKDCTMNWHLDITENKRAEEKTQRLINAIDGLTETVSIYDSEDRMMYCNKTFRDRNQSVAEFIAPGVKYEDFIRAGVAKGIFLDAIGQEEAWISKRLGQHRACGEPFTVVRNDSYLLINEQRLPDGGLATLAIDISAQKLAEEKVKASEARLNEVFAIAPEAIITVGEDMNIQLFNASAERIFGYSTDEIVGRSMDILLPEPLRQKHGKHFKNFENSLGAYLSVGEGGEISGLRKDGTEFPASVSVSKLKVNSETIYTVMLHDITQRRIIEEERRKAQADAEKASQAKSKFLANMSHEIRTPMNGVVGMVDVLMQMNMEPEQERMIQTIRKSSFALLRIIDDILDTSKIEAGKLELENVSVQLHQTIEAVVETMVPTADAANVRLSLFIDQKLPKWINSDAGRLRQVLLNLLSNAVKFSRPKEGQAFGRVNISATLTPRHSLQFTVADDGIGMTEGVRSKLFKPFVQGEESTTREFGGTGLGLVISHNLVGMMGGTITVDSALGKGSTFTVTLPLEELDIQVVMPDLSGLKLLALFDDTIPREISSAYASYCGATLRFAENEAELAAFVAEEENETIILLAQETLAENDRIRKSLSDGSGRQRFLSLTTERPNKLGLTAPDRYVIQRFPVLPSDLFRGLAVLSGRATQDRAMTNTELKSSSSAPSIEEVEAENRLILLVEDNETNQEVIKYQLDMLGYMSEVAEDGQRGLEMWQAGQFDLILSDCHMPVMDGFEMTAAIRNIEKKKGYARIPIVAITANALQGEADNCLAAGMDDYLSKPVELKRLKQTLGCWLSKEAGGEAPRIF